MGYLVKPAFAIAFGKHSVIKVKFNFYPLQCRPKSCQLRRPMVGRRSTTVPANYGITNVPRNNRWAIHDELQELGVRGTYALGEFHPWAFINFSHGDVMSLTHDNPDHIPAVPTPDLHQPTAAAAAADAAGVLPSGHPIAGHNLHCDSCLVHNHVVHSLLRNPGNKFLLTVRAFQMSSQPLHPIMQHPAQRLFGQ